MVSRFPDNAVLEESPDEACLLESINLSDSLSMSSNVRNRLNRMNRTHVTEPFPWAKRNRLH